jgi:hypothetical protein
MQMYPSFFIAHVFDVYGPICTIMPMMLIIMTLYLVWLANNAKAKGDIH